MARKEFDRGLGTLESDSLNPDEDADLLEEMIDQMIKATERAEKRIDDTLVFVEASNRRIAAMETQADKFRKSMLTH